MGEAAFVRLWPRLRAHGFHTFDTIPRLNPSVARTKFSCPILGKADVADTLLRSSGKGSAQIMVGDHGHTLSGSPAERQKLAPESHDRAIQEVAESWEHPDWLAVLENLER